MSVKILKVPAICGFRREQKEEVRKVWEIGIKLHWYRIGSSSLDSDSSEDFETDSGNQATGGSRNDLEHDKDGDLLSSSICHFEEEMNKRRIGNNSYSNSCV